LLYAGEEKEAVKNTTGWEKGKRKRKYTKLRGGGNLNSVRRQKKRLR